MSKYVKVMFGTTSGAKSDFEYKLNEVNESNNWNPNADNPREFGGFNYCDETCILRWLHRGDTIYEVEIPDDAEIVRLEGATIIYRANKIIIKNPTKVDDDLAFHFYQISNIPEKSYYKALGAVAVMNYEKTAMQIIQDKVNKDNIDLVLEEWNNFIEHGKQEDRMNVNDLISKIENKLYDIKNIRKDIQDLISGNVLIIDLNVKKIYFQNEELDLINLKNCIANAWYENDKDNELEGISRETFVNNLKLIAIEVSIRTVNYWFDDNNMYGGHNIIVSKKHDEDKYLIDMAG